jgi:hypothetical protein
MSNRKETTYMEVLITMVTATLGLLALGIGAFILLPDSSTDSNTRIGTDHRNRPKCHRSLRATFVPLAMLLGIVLANPALAVDGKEYPGSMCKEGTDGPNGHIPRPTGDIVYDFDGNALHIGAAGFRYVSCPLVRDSERHTGTITYAAVNIYKPSSTAQYCQLVSTPYFGGAGWVTTKWDTSTATGLHLLELPVQADTDISGSFNLWCVLNPPANGNKSGIAHYGIIEAD